jgi:branched-chain amino acid transport system permease protein
VNIVVDAIVNGTILGAAYGIAGVVFGLLYRIVKVFHFAFAAIGTVGAFTAAVVATAMKEWTGLLVGTLLGMVIAGVLTALAYVAVYRPLTKRGASSGTTFVSSLALGLIIEAGLVVIAGPTNRTYVLGGFTTQTPILGLNVSGLHALAVGSLIVVTGICLLYMKRTRAGRQTEALISNVDQAELVGIRTGLMSVLLCVGLGALSVIAFVIQGMNSSLSIGGGVPLALFGVLAMLCGGVANIWGTAIAGLLIGIVGGLAATVVPGQWSSTIVFVVAMIVVLIRPNSGAPRVRLPRAKTPSSTPGNSNTEKVTA